MLKSALDLLLDAGGWAVSVNWIKGFNSFIYSYSGFGLLRRWLLSFFYGASIRLPKNKVDKAQVLKNKKVISQFSLILVICLWTAVFVLGIDLIWGDYSGSESGSEATRLLGPFGDFFAGVLNPIFTLATFFGLLLTIVLQRIELGLTRSELKKSAVALEDQARLTSRQKFDSTFFSLLDEHNQILNRINQVPVSFIEGSRTSLGGPFPEMGWVGGSEPDDFPVTDQVLDRVYSKCDLFSARLELSFCNRHIGQYFRVLYQILKYICENHPDTSYSGGDGEGDILSSKPSKEEKKYSNIVRAFINEEILHILAVNGYSDSCFVGYEKYRALIIRYQMLEHMSFDIAGRNHPVLMELVDHYADNDYSAFGDNIAFKSLVQSLFLQEIDKEYFYQEMYKEPKTLGVLVDKFGFSRVVLDRFQELNSSISRASSDGS